MPAEKEKAECSDCDGNGTVEEECSCCGGSGYENVDCDACGGTGEVEDEE